MKNLVWSNSYIRALKNAVKKNPKSKPVIEEALRLLQENPFSPKLETHKLKGKLQGSGACSVDHDMRIVFDFMKNADQQEVEILLVDIGTHDEVY